MVAESGRHPASKLLRGIPTLGAVRVAQLISVAATPHRFRTKRQFWSYCGLAVQTHSSADYRFEGSELRRTTKKTATRGLKREHNRTVKSVFKGAALTASRCEPFRTSYAELIARGLRPELARVTIARRIAALTLSVWKRGETFDECKLIKVAA
jgi:transposase